MSRIAEEIKEHRLKIRELKENSKVVKGSQKLAKSKGGGSVKGRKVIPLAERERIAQMSIMGESNRAISRETGHSQKAVAKIIKEADQPAYVEKMRERFVGLGGIALDCLEKKMKAGDHELAYKFLRDIGVIGVAQLPKAQIENINTNNEGEHKQVAFAPATRDMILASLSESDQRTFRMLEMFRRKQEAYGMPESVLEPKAQQHELESAPGKSA